MKKMYLNIRSNELVQVNWYRLFCENVARPRAIMTLWLACQGRLATKDRMQRLGVVQNATCCFFSCEETLNHIFYVCAELKSIWREVLDWIQIKHEPKEWVEEMDWLVMRCNGKGVLASILKLAATETIYGSLRNTWHLMNLNYQHRKKHQRKILLQAVIGGNQIKLGRIRLKHLVRLHLINLEDDYDAQLNPMENVNLDEDNVGQASGSNDEEIEHRYETTLTPWC
ncbi:hypothetical protein Lal_00022730 [Lupinus albus]|nr:hypothetical protein Lal_00022730 [Lupinus albus]